MQPQIKFNLVLLAVIVATLAAWIALNNSGCAAQTSVDVQPVLDIRPDTNIGPEITAGGDNVTAGRTAVNVAPTVYIGGSTIIALCGFTTLLAAMLAVLVIRQKVIIKAIVQGVEDAEGAGISTKHSIRLEAEERGVEKHLNRLVGRLTR